MNVKKGFTLIELLVVVAIIAILTALVLNYLGSAKNKGNDAGVKSNLRNAMAQGEILYNMRTANRDTYINVCTNGTVDGAQGVGSFILAAAKVVGLSSYAMNSIGTATTATCNNSSNAWAAQVPLPGSTVASPRMWCVDNTGKSRETVNSLTTAVTYACI